jgi:ribose transport system substrate-binding protein
LFLGALSTLTGACALAQERWDGPTRGPVAQTGKALVYIASDLRNGSVGTVYRGLQEAAHTLGWSVTLMDGAGSKDKQSDALSAAIAGNAQGIVFGGFEPNAFTAQLTAIAQKNIVLVGWHAAKDPGPTRELFVNVATDPVDVARMAANFVIQDAMDKKRPVGVIIFNDHQFAVANAKSDAMKKTIEACHGYRGCKVLSVENVPISDAGTEIPKAIPKLVSTYGAAWTYSLAINDAYFDAMNFPLREARRSDILNVSAGDGSVKALSRIGWGMSQQLATVAEPLKMQGYQLADELNRAFAGEPPSGYVAKPMLVTHALIKAMGTSDIESALGFEAAYHAIWMKR